jgi:hypothetical protein
MRWPSSLIVFRAASIVLGRDHAAGTSERRSATQEMLRAATSDGQRATGQAVTNDDDNDNDEI